MSYVLKVSEGAIQEQIDRVPGHRPSGIRVNVSLVRRWAEVECACGSVQRVAGDSDFLELVRLAYRLHLDVSLQTVA